MEFQRVTRVPKPKESLSKFFVLPASVRPRSERRRATFRRLGRSDPGVFSGSSCCGTAGRTFRPSLQFRFSEFIDSTNSIPGKAGISRRDTTKRRHIRRPNQIVMSRNSTIAPIVCRRKLMPRERRSWFGRARLSPCPAGIGLSSHHARCAAPVIAQNVNGAKVRAPAMDEVAERRAACSRLHPFQMIASMPLRRITSSSASAGPVGRFAPRSSCET